MKQQESNLFDKGMSLDTNPIAMDNHTLSGALNATMITMNGNELVLQNDMGNARVETAYLPDGFVPVGMKEHGGIVYVASYNPISDQSLIGSFPSPERNISNEDAGQSSLLFNTLSGVVDGDKNSVVTITYEREAIKIGDSSKSKDIIRPGDQIAFFGNIYGKLTTYAKLSAIIVDSDNNAVDVSDNFLKESGDSYTVPVELPTNIPYYKGKISGKLYLVETLRLPNYITVTVGGDKVDNTITLTLTPGVDEESKDFLNNYEYYISYSGSVEGNRTISKGESCSIKELPLEGVLNYTVTLQLPYGKILSMNRSGSIDLSKVGTGDIDFKYFFYYNDTKREQILFDYDLIAYLKDNLELTNCYLDLVELNLSNADKQIYPANDPSNDPDPGITHRIELPINSMAGNFSAIIPYGSGTDGTPASTLAMGKIYFGKLKVVETLDAASEVKEAKTPVLIITSSVTNDYYMENSTGDIGTGENFMSLLSDSAQTVKEILLDCDIDWKEEIRENISKPQNIPGFTNDVGIITQQDSNYNSKKLVLYGLQQTTTMLVDIIPTIKMKYPDESFPLEETLKLTYPNSEEKVTYLSDLNWTFSQTSVKTTLEENHALTLEEAVEEDTDINTEPTIISEQSRTVIGNKLRIVFNNTLLTKFYGILGNPDTYFNNDCDSLVPYMELSNLTQVQELIGGSVYLNQNKELTSMRPESWFTFETWESGKNDRAREIAIMHAPSWYTSAREAGGVPEQGETNEEGSIGLFLTTSTNANWTFYSKTVIDYYHNNLGIYPTILFLQGANAGGTGLKVARSFFGLNVSTYDYAIPILLSTSDELYMLNEWDNFTPLPLGSKTSNSGITAETATNHPLYAIVEKLSLIYILQSGQVVEFRYKKTEDYGYIMPYTITVKVPVKVKLEIEFGNYDTKKVEIDNKEYFLPKFNLRNDTFSHKSEYSVSSPDSYSDIEQYISALIELGSCALTPSGALITLDHNGKKLDSSHPYYYDSTNNTLIDCYEEQVSANGVANALYKYNLYLLIRKNVNTNYNSIYVNKTNISGALENHNNCTRCIGGNEGKLTEIRDIAPKHILKPMFGLRQSLKVVEDPHVNSLPN